MPTSRGVDAVKNYLCLSLTHWFRKAFEGKTLHNLLTQQNP